MKQGGGRGSGSGTNPQHAEAGESAIEVEQGNRSRSGTAGDETPGEFHPSTEEYPAAQESAAIAPSPRTGLCGPTRTRDRATGQKINIP